MGLKDYASKAAAEQVGGYGDFFNCKGSGRCVVQAHEIFLGDNGVCYALRVVILDSSNPTDIAPGSTKVSISKIGHSEAKKRKMALRDMKANVCAVAGIDAESIAPDAFVQACTDWVDDKTDKSTPKNTRAVGRLLQYDVREVDGDKGKMYFPKFRALPQTDAARAEMAKDLISRELDAE